MRMSSGGKIAVEKEKVEKAEKEEREKKERAEKEEKEKKEEDDARAKKFNELIAEGKYAEAGALYE